MERFRELCHVVRVFMSIGSHLIEGKRVMFRPETRSLKSVDVPVGEIAEHFQVARSTLYRTLLKPIL